MMNINLNQKRNQRINQKYINNLTYSFILKK